MWKSCKQVVTVELFVQDQLSQDMKQDADLNMMGSANDDVPDLSNVT